MKQTILDQGNQLLIFTGARGVGKTSAVAGYEPPSRVEKVFYHDSEDSANNVNAGLAENGVQYGHYANLKARFANRLPSDDDLLDRINKGTLPWVDTRGRNALVDYYLSVVDDLSSNLENGKYSTYIHDTIEMLEAGMAAWVDTHKKEAGVTQIGYGQLWTVGVFPLYAQLLEGIHARGVRTILLSSHLKTPWEGNRPVAGKVVPSGKKILYFLSRFFVWLVKEPINPNGEPAGLVLKERLAKFAINKEKDEWEIKRMIPRRIPVFTWPEVRRYLIDGCDLQNPLPGETPNSDEEALMQDMALSDKQIELMLIQAKTEYEQVKNQGSMFVPTTEAVEVAVATANGSEISLASELRLIADSLGTENASAVRDKYQEKYGVELSLPQIVRALKESK